MSPRPLSASMQAALAAERTGEVIAYLLTIASRENYERAVLKSKPAGYWRLGEDVGQATAWDAIAGRNLAHQAGVTAGIAASLADGDKAARYNNGGTSYSVYNATGTELAARAPLSLECVAFCRSIGSNFASILKRALPAGGAATEGQGVNFLIQDSGRLGVRFDTSTLQNGFLFPVAGLIIRDAWRHLGLTLDAAGNAVLIVDGAVYGQGVNADWATFTTSGGTFGVPGGASSQGTGHSNDCDADEVAVYDRVLPVSEFLTHFQALSLPTVLTMRFTDHKPSVVSRGRTYTSATFEYILPDDSEDTPPAPRLRIGNVSRTIIEGLRSIDVRRPLSITAELIRVADPNTVEITLPRLLLLRAQANAFHIEGDLGSRFMSGSRWPKQRFLPSTHAGLFQGVG